MLLGRDVRIANWYENCKPIIWKMQTQMKIANVNVGPIHQNVRIANIKIANWNKNCKLMWKLQSNSHFSMYGNVPPPKTNTAWVPGWCPAVATGMGLKTCSGKEFLGWVAAWMTNTHREQSLAIPSTIILIVLRTTSQKRRTTHLRVCRSLKIYSLKLIQQIL
jgi:hypothetical protein